MDSRLKVEQLPRSLAAEVRPETPLVALAWRELQAEHDRHRAQTGRIRETLADLANEAFRLDRLSRPDGDEQPEVQTDNWNRTLAGMARRMQHALARVDVRLCIPLGEVFDTQMMELFENVAQRPDPQADQPRVVEVIDPAIVCEGNLLRRGKVAVAVPAAPTVQVSAEPASDEANVDNGKHAADSEDAPSNEVPQE